MSRGSTVVAIGAVFAMLWGIAFYQTLSEGSYAHTLIKALPSYLVIVLGCYAMFEIGVNIYTIQDSPKEHQNLLEDIKRAVKNLPERVL